MKGRFKIDLSGSSSWRYALYRRQGWLCRTGWEYIQSFETKEEARAYYDTIKDLPEYLD